MVLSLEERFWAKVNKTDTCWLWTGGRGRDGYGLYLNKPVHRLAYEFVVGLIPEGLQVDHLCRVVLCVRPTHLEPVTPQENNRRSLSPSALNARKETCVSGHVFDEANTYLRNGERRCRTCRTEARRRYDARERAAGRKPWLRGAARMVPS